ncbi:metal ABC transporter permease [Anaerococcus tetradius]|uniref:ABC 3 transport family protein n=1 Tax=Anaerococcus tetradius ATCC 35098 TaxID=525255 RepID=C2CI11_9FIRM|nr:metal ABC transporter permease [Anaerococcus tetradius]EEI82806.1 ABC 3 transport family protein [Anaerococcus tetradius ATCC 35098]
MLEYDFMRRALLAGGMLAIIIPMIGVVMINRKTSMIGDALSHSSLSGVALGLIFGINPLWSSLLICVLASFAIEVIRRRFKQYGDMATAIVMSAGIGLAAVLSDFTTGGKSFESFMFGSITTVSKEDLRLIGIIFVLVLVLSLYFYNALLYNSINPMMSRLSGVKTDLVDSFFTLITAITVAISAKTVGALMISSLMVIPVASALLIAKSYKASYLIAIILSLIFMLSGISISFYQGIKPGGAIVLIAIGFLLVISLFSLIKKKILVKK